MNGWIRYDDTTLMQHWEGLPRAQPAALPLLKEGLQNAALDVLAERGRNMAREPPPTAPASSAQAAPLATPNTRTDEARMDPYSFAAFVECIEEKDRAVLEAWNAKQVSWACCRIPSVMEPTDVIAFLRTHKAFWESFETVHFDSALDSRTVLRANL